MQSFGFSFKSFGLCFKSFGVSFTNFGFGLITGVGTVTKIKNTDPAEYKTTLSPGKWIELHTILCGLRQLSANKQPYKIDVDFDKKSNSK